VAQRGDSRHGDDRACGSRFHLDHEGNPGTGKP
jgi:hypothetical protein